MSAERPILFSGPMVRAILAGAKTQTRRPVKPAVTVQPPGTPTWYPPSSSPTERSRAYDGEAHFRRGMPVDFGPCHPGDALWVRETWAFRAEGSRVDVCYAVDGARRTRVVPDHWRPPMAGLRGEGWVPSIHMPRWASRLTLDAIEVRAQRVQDITEEEARAEGVEADDEPCDHSRLSCAEVGCEGPGFRAAFGNLWNSIYAATPGLAWRDNPWVWAVTFGVSHVR